MKLGEAKTRLEQIDVYLEDSLITLSLGPLATLGDTLDKCDSLLLERQNLRRRVRETEETTDLGGQSVREVSEALKVLTGKISFLEKLTVRDDLSASQRAPLFTQLESYRSTRDTLRLSLEKCLWEFELVE
jgi:hypothetical protein